MNNDVYDILGVGVGPFNLSLACMAEPLSELKTVFFDKKTEFDWHSGIMPEWSTLQIPFFADLVTFADPTSRFSFLNYLKSTGLIYQYYIRESFFMLRSEYNDYCKWVAEQLDNVQFGYSVQNIDYSKAAKIYTVTLVDSDNQASQVQARHIVLGTGTTPVIPDFCHFYKDQIHMGANYLKHKEAYKNAKSITIVGSGQSGAEIYYDLLNDIDTHKYQLNWITRSNRFFAMDLNKLTLELTSPDYTSHFYDLDPEKRDELINSQAPLYKGINNSLINEIYDTLYIKTRNPEVKTRLIPSAQLNSLQYDDNQFTLSCSQKSSNKDFEMESEFLILSLGYEYKKPEFLCPIAQYLNWDNQERLLPNKNYSITDENNIFVQNVGLYTHGISAPDLGMGCYRNAIIINQVMGQETYPVEKRICFQEFSPE